MNFTYRNNLWKGEATNTVIPTNSRPFINNDPTMQNIARVPFKPNPIKHWRKQLQPRYKTASSKQVSIDQYYAPNSAVYIGSQVHNCETNNYHLLKENITLLNDCVGVKLYDASQNQIRCIGGSHNVRRSASTNLKPNYYRNYSKYLQTKCKTYDQNSSIGDQNDDGTYKSAKCSDLYTKCNKPIIYKPSNSAHFQQGAVSASANILRKRYNAMTNNSASLKTAYGNSYIKQVIHDGETGYNIQFLKGSYDSDTLCRQQFKACNTS